MCVCVQVLHQPSGLLLTAPKLHCQVHFYLCLRMEIKRWWLWNCGSYQQLHQNDVFVSILVSLGFLSSVTCHNIVLLFKIQPLFIAKGKYLFNFGIKIGRQACKWNPKVWYRLQNGEIFFFFCCVFSRHKLGSLKNQRFEVVWNLLPCEPQTHASNPNRPLMDI